MISKNIISRASAVLCAAAVMACCGSAADAAELYDAPLQENTAAVMTVNVGNGPEAVYTADTDTFDYGYDVYGDSYDYHYDHYERNVSGSKGDKNWVKIILIALGVSLAVTGITVYIIYRGYKYNGMTEPYEYKNKAGLDLAVKEDRLVDVHVTSVHINRDNS